ncbi:uncharacterized protein K489DRAFT_385356 [Dissoconium aciculare CBS 342.82]|uniref:Uncharacterized protein n=1 Tax=Dissoconium aciculare CBS 342.82 TaxID=1314786 RepID=A0A6J3LQQ8_9PEZI|nr:uncharacterized protein K489DRAFT_385356 [Dissoconium aciculare CBS 342.82]KAF1817963.1 hypothetical protein K489DRAFT_385356 [Dissoconium aciculare CBS 342.82]
MTEWRITEQNPVREDIEGLDFERCAALHNLIAERGWSQRGKDPNHLDRTTWWECYGGESSLESYARRLDESVVSFLKLAWSGFSRDPSHGHAFHQILVGLSAPENICNDVTYEDYDDDDSKCHFITLYSSNWQLADGHPQGLVFDQEEFSAMQHLSMEDTAITMNGRQERFRLEQILEALLEMMDQGKVVAVDDSYSGQQEQFCNWIMSSYTESDLEESLDALDALVSAVEERMPIRPAQTGFEIGLIDKETSTMFPPGTFARHFLERARRPRFKFLAPGLYIATNQPFASTLVDDEDTLRPVLLLQSSDSAHRDTFPTPWGESYSHSAFGGEFREIEHYPSGLYLTEIHPHSESPFEDGCKLILPFPIGENGWARTSDGAVFGEEKKRRGEVAVPYPTSTELFQLGYNHFIKRHDVQLKDVLWRWVELVESGEWGVDEDGVKGNIEKWREADTEDHWRDYQLPMDW